MAGPRAKVTRGRQTTERQSAQRGSRPDPVVTNFNQTGWGQIVNKDPRFDYHFWPEGMGHGTLGVALDKGWEIITASSPADQSAERVLGGRTAKVGEPLRGIHGQIACRRPIEFSEFAKNRKRAFWQSIESRMGHERPEIGEKERLQHSTQAEQLLQQFAGYAAPEDNEGHIATGIGNRTSVEGEGPYPAFQE